MSAKVAQYMLFFLSRFVGTGANTRILVYHALIVYFTLIKAPTMDAT